MRVISGLRKGHKLKSPKGKNTRPTEDRVKESLFNIIGQVDENAIILDGFAGSGAIGIEFLSRGADLCYFVDNSIDSIKTIKENLLHTKFLEQSKIYKKDILFLTKEFKVKKIQFDYIYLDPPFRQNDLINNILKSIDFNNIIKAHGKIIIEHEKELELDDEIYNLKKVDYRNYGSKTITFYTKIDRSE